MLNVPWVRILQYLSKCKGESCYLLHLLYSSHYFGLLPLYRLEDRVNLMLFHCVMRLRSELPHSLWLVDRHNPKYHGIASGWITTAITVSNMEKCINNHRKHSVLDLSLWILFYKISKKTLQFKVGWQSFWKGNNLTGALIGTVGWLASRQKKKGSLSHACILWCHNINVINSL